MQCLDESSVAAFFDRKLSSAAVAQIDEHVATCIACHDLLAVFAELYPAVKDGSAFAPTTPAEHDSSGESGFRASAAIGRHLAAVQAQRRVGTELAGRWTLERVLGVGGMGQVFSATHRNGRRAAIKVLRPELSGAPSVVKRFVQEGYAANRVGHPGAVSVLDDGVADDGSIFLVMDLLEGETLKARLAHGGPLPVAEALRFADEVLVVLAAAHAKGIIHRDIKPENLFVTTDGAIRVLDFGIARVRELSSESGATESGMTMGTPAFMPPEQARGQSSRVDARADLWALGATMFALLTGEPIRGAETGREELFLAMTKPARPIATVLPDLPSRVARVVDRALAFDPEDRWPDALTMRQAILDATLPGPASVRTSRLRRPMAKVAVGAGVLGAVLLLFGLKNASRSVTATVATSVSPPQTGPTKATPPAPPLPIASEPPPSTEAPRSAVDRAPSKAGSTAPVPSIAARAPSPSASVPAVASIASAGSSQAPSSTMPLVTDPPRDPLDRHY